MNNPKRNRYLHSELQDQKGVRQIITKKSPAFLLGIDRFIINNWIGQVLVRYTAKYRNRPIAISTFTINNDISFISTCFLYSKNNINNCKTKKQSDTQIVVPALIFPLPNNPNCTNDAII
jgi:hypothetical protein